MRGLVILAVILVLVIFVWPPVRARLERLLRTRLAEHESRDRLVKDPVCGTYVVRSRAIRDEAGGRSVYFCSQRCAARFTEQERSA
jgi:YHS domain-containing protein